MNHLQKWAGVDVIKKIFFLMGGRERERSTRCSLYSCTHWLILACTLTGDGTHNLGVWGRCSNQLSYLARADVSFDCCAQPADFA